VPVHLDLFGDRPELLTVTPVQLSAHRALIEQAYLLFGSKHPDHYDFLVSVSDAIPVAGLEHHRSSFDGVYANYFTEWDKSSPLRDLLAHEFTHSWNGKFRRPADLWTANYNVPMRASLLWVYEGQTQYWGHVLTARAGLWSKDQALDALALVAARYQAEPGRAWRPLQDTTEQPIIAYRGPLPWRSWQRGADYYDVGQLIWLDADTLIREQSHGQRSLDDFARQFFGVQDGSYGEVTYAFADVVAALNRVQPYDWAAFLRQRLDAVNADPPIAGITRGGYRLVFTDTASDHYKQEEEREKLTALTYSVGMSVDKEGKIKEVLWNGPAFKAGLSPATQIIAVNGTAFEGDRLKEAIKAAGHSTAAMELIVREGDQFRTVQLEYHGGLRYPHLERDPAHPALLDAILARRT
jgi:predicted metalloprotease with PDZ domain